MQFIAHEATSQRNAHRIAQLAYEAMVAEVTLTPKPGLVDRRGAGSHRDLTLDLMLCSAAVIRPFFVQMAVIASDCEPSPSLREDLAQIGRAAERGMFEVTGGANAHKGAIWIIGLLVAGAAQRDSASQIVDIASRIARFPDRKLPRLVTHGDSVRQQFGARGARGEAEEGFPNLLRHGLPTLKTCLRAGATPEIAQLNALMELIQHVEDTCVLYRGGKQALEIMQRGARRVRYAGGLSAKQGSEQLLVLDATAKRLGVSPGGSADLLAAAIFLNNIEDEVPVSTITGRRKTIYGEA